MKPLGDHLGPEDNIRLTACNALPCLIVGAAAAHCIGIHAEHAGFGKKLLEFLLDSLGSLAKDGQRRGGALRASGRHGDFASAKMAHEALDYGLGAFRNDRAPRHAPHMLSAGFILALFRLSVFLLFPFIVPVPRIPPCGGILELAEKLIEDLLDGCGARLVLRGAFALAGP